MEGKLVRSRVWDGQVPLQISLHPSLFGGSGSPPPFFIMAWRCSYLPILMAQIKRHFSRHLNLPVGLNLQRPDASEVLSTHLPLGLLYDLHSQSAIWHLHLVGSADNPILDEVEMSMRFFSSLKQADALRSNGQAKRVMALSKADQTQLWESVQAHRGDLYWPINEVLVEPYPKGERAAIRVYEGSSVRQWSIGLEGCLGDLGLKGECWLHGVRVPKETPLAWLNQYMAYPDNMLHIVVRPFTKGI